MKKFAPLFVLTAGILWGMIGIFVRKLNDLSFGSLEIVNVRAITTTILLFLFLLIYNRDMLKIRLKDLWCFLGTGILSIVFFNYCYFKAITLTSLSVAAVLLYTAPVFVMFISAVLFREKITGIKIISVILTFVGCVLVTGVVGNLSSGNNSGSLSVNGIVVGLMAGLGYALYSIFSRFALERGYHSLTISFYTFLFAAIGTLPLSDSNVVINACKNNLKTIFFCFIFGLVSTVIPYILYTLGLKDMENGQASIIASIEPVAATLLGLLVYHEVLKIQNIIGISLVLGAIVICNLKKSSSE